MTMDKTISKLITQEVRRQNETLDLIPSENTVSHDVLARAWFGAY